MISPCFDLIGSILQEFSQKSSNDNWTSNLWVRKERMRYKMSYKPLVRVALDITVETELC